MNVGQIIASITLMLTHSYSKLWIKLFCEINACKSFSVMPFDCHCKHPKQSCLVTSSLSWVAWVHSACWISEQEFWRELSENISQICSWWDMTSNQGVVKLYPYGPVIAKDDSWDHMNDIFTQASVLAKLHSFRRIYFNRVSNVQTKPAVIRSIWRACVRIGFFGLFL